MEVNRQKMSYHRSKMILMENESKLIIDPKNGLGLLFDYGNDKVKEKKEVEANESENTKQSATLDTPQ